MLKLHYFIMRLAHISVWLVIQQVILFSIHIMFCFVIVLQLKLLHVYWFFAEVNQKLKWIA